jgi:hypothetical protein
VNSLKRTFGILLAIAFSLLVISPVTLSSGVVSAQTGYSINQVDHQIQVMYSGHIVVLDTIHVSGQVTDGFMVGLPFQYSANVLKGFAYDDTHQYQLNLGVQMQSDQGSFYGAEVNFNGNSPSVFTVAFILSNDLIIEGEESLTLNYPAYPSLTRDVGTCNVNLLFPSAPTSLTITKDDGEVNTGSYTKTNLPAYTYSVGSASFTVPTGTLQLSTISTLDRQINIDATGKVTAIDAYHIINDASTQLSSFVLSLPLEAQNLAISDGVGKQLSFLVSTAASGNMQLANVTLSTFLSNAQTTTLTARYDLPSATLQGVNYVLSNFQIFPSFSYYVNQATATFNPPEGATIVTPQASALSESSTLTRNTYQDTLSITETGLSYVDYQAHQPSTLQFAYNYNPVWVSFRPTFWAALIAVVGCIGAIVYRRRKPKEVTYAERAEQLQTYKEAAAMHGKVNEGKPNEHISVNDIEEFLDAFEDRKQLTNELRSLDVRAQKGKIPRRQYKVQRQAIEIRLEGINRSIERKKAKFRGHTGVYGDLAKQLDLAEEDLSEAEENLRTLESHQSRGEISLETYKRSIGDYQKQRNKAESAINGILLRLREKIR